MQIHRPTTLNHALDLMADSAPPPTPIAGGTDLLVSWHHLPKNDLALLDLSLLPELRAFQLTDEFLELGGSTTYWDVIESVEVSQAFPLLAQAARQVGAIRHGTKTFTFAVAGTGAGPKPAGGK